MCEVQDKLGRPILLENISAYVAFRDSVIPEWEFLNELTAHTGCRLLLDVNNVYVTSQNLGFDPVAYIRSIRSASVGQIHLAGHTRQPDFILDSHVGPVPGEVWDLYRLAVQHFGRVSTLVEWDEAVPALSVVLSEAERARRIQRELLA